MPHVWNLLKENKKVKLNNKIKIEPFETEIMEQNCNSKWSLCDLDLLKKTWLILEDLQDIILQANVWADISGLY